MGTFNGMFDLRHGILGFGKTTFLWEEITGSQGAITAGHLSFRDSKDTFFLSWLLSRCSGLAVASLFCRDCGLRIPLIVVVTGYYSSLSSVRKMALRFLVLNFNVSICHDGQREALC